MHNKEFEQENNFENEYFLDVIKYNKIIISTWSNNNTNII